MSLVRGIEIRPLASVKGGMTEFYTPQTSHETILVQIPAGTIEDLFVHKSQTDQLLVVKGRFVLVVLIDRRYQYIPLSEHQPVVVKIPQGVLHGAINIDPDPCVLVNAVLRHGPANKRDYQPKKRPFSYDIAAVKAVLAELDARNAVGTMPTATI